MRRMRHVRARLVVSLIFLAYLSSPASAAPGDLDTSFGGDGWETTDFDLADLGQDVVIQPDGKIVVAGWTETADGGDFAVARYNSDGTLDSSFGDAGKVTSSLSSGEDKAFGVAVQPDGAIVVAGVTWSGPDERQAFGLIRYASNGTVDATFGTDGMVQTNFTSRRDRAAAVAIQNDGKIVVAGTAYPGDFAVARYNPDGSLDTSFSGDGRKTADFKGARDAAKGLGIQGNGKIVVSGSSNRRLAVARFRTNGRLDRTFSGDGRAITDTGGGWAAGGGELALQADGKIVVAGTSQQDFFLVRYKRDGYRDRTFSEDGARRINIGGCFPPDFGTDVAVQPDGKIVEVGTTGDSASGSLCLAVARVRSGGRLDGSFGGDGKVTASIGYIDSGETVALQADGKIVVAGSTTVGYPDSPDRDFLVARFLP